MYTGRRLIRTNSTLSAVAGIKKDFTCLHCENKGLVTNHGGSGLQNGRGSGEVLPLRKGGGGGRKCLSHAEGGGGGTESFWLVFMW